MTRHMGILKCFLLAAATLLIAVPKLWASPLGDQAVFIEINDTDGDAGLQIFLDGEGWNDCTITDPEGNVILTVTGEGSVAQQGITELALESAEPSFAEQPLEDFLARFIEGQYIFTCTSEDGTQTGKAKLTHDLPDAPVIVSPQDGDDSVDPNNTVIEWMPVADPGTGSKIVGYRVEGEGGGQSISIEVEPTITMVMVPQAFMKANTDYKFEVIVTETSGNRTISEIEFKTD